MTLSQCLSCPIRTLLFSRPPFNCNYSTTGTATATIPIPNWSHFPQFRAHPLLFLTSSPKPISKFQPFSLYCSGSRSISHARFSTTPGEEATDTRKLRVLKQKIEVLGINCDSCTPGRYNLLICPKCKGGQSMERGLSFHISENGEFAMWRCFRVECGWAGQAFADNSAMYNGVNKISKVNFPGQMTAESLGLEPLSEKDLKTKMMIGLGPEKNGLYLLSLPLH